MDMGGRIASAYDALESTREAEETHPTNIALEEAWVVIQVLWSKKDELREEAQGLRSPPSTRGPSPAGLGEAVRLLSDHLSNLRADVFSKASEQLDKVEGLAADMNGKAQTMVLLERLVALAPTLENVERLADKAEEPIRFPQPQNGRRVMTALSELDEDLDILDRSIGALSAQDLSDDAVLAIILKPVREELKSADTQISTAEDIAKVWPKIRRDYGRNSKLVRLGHRISRDKRLVEGRKQKWGPPPSDLGQPINNLKEAEGHLMNAYHYLLEGNTLDAEVEVKRADYLIQDAYTWRIIWILKEKFLINGRNHVRVTERPSPWLRPILGIAVIAALLLGVVLVIPWDYFKVLAMKIMPWLPSAFRGEVAIKWRVAGVGLCVLGLLLLWSWVRPYWSSLIYRFVAERWENLAISLVRLALRVGSGLLSLVITTTLILAYQQTIPREQLATWGSLYDLLVAFSLGVLAHRALRAL